MPPRSVLYFAHPVNVYDTHLERRLLAHIAARFPDSRILNPNAPEHDAGYKTKGMAYFLEDILPGCGECVVLAFLDGKIGKGVYAEAEQLHKAGCPVWEITILGGFIAWAPDPSRCLTLEETRERIRDEAGNTRPY
jgi:hypothetical protein